MASCSTDTFKQLLLGVDLSNGYVAKALPRALLDAFLACLTYEGSWDRCSPAKALLTHQSSLDGRTTRQSSRSQGSCTSGQGCLAGEVRGDRLLGRISTDLLSQRLVLGVLRPDFLRQAHQTLHRVRTHIRALQHRTCTNSTRSATLGYGNLTHLGCSQCGELGCSSLDTDLDTSADLAHDTQLSSLLSQEVRQGGRIFGGFPKGSTELSRNLCTDTQSTVTDALSGCLACFPCNLGFLLGIGLCKCRLELFSLIGHLADGLSLGAIEVSFRGFVVNHGRQLGQAIQPLDSGQSYVLAKLAPGTAICNRLFSQCLLTILSKGCLNILKSSKLVLFRLQDLIDFSWIGCPQLVVQVGVKIEIFHMCFLSGGLRLF